MNTVAAAAAVLPAPRQARLCPAARLALALVHACAVMVMRAHIYAYACGGCACYGRANPTSANCPVPTARSMLQTEPVDCTCMGRGTWRSRGASCSRPRDGGSSRSSSRYEVAAAKSSSMTKLADTEVDAELHPTSGPEQLAGAISLKISRCGKMCENV